MTRTRIKTNLCFTTRLVSDHKIKSETSFTSLKSQIAKRKLNELFNKPTEVYPIVNNIIFLNNLK